MSPKLGRWVVVFLTLVIGLAGPQPAAASPEGESYLTFVFFADFLNGDCFKFNDDGTFEASYGLITGEWTEEEITILLFFTFPYYEVTVESPENPVFTLVDLGDYIDVGDLKIVAGAIETDDDDSGFFLGIGSRICRYPARVPGQRVSLAQSSPAASAAECCGAGLEQIFMPPADASRPANRQD